MQTRIVSFSLLDQFPQPRKNPLFVHRRKRRFILPAVEEEKRDYQVKGISRVFLSTHQRLGIGTALASLSVPAEHC